MSLFRRKYKWHNEYPKNCPKKGVQAIQMEVFRFVNSDPPTMLDFMPHAKQNIKWYMDCNGWGLSFYTTEKIMKQKQNNSLNFKNKLIAKGVIEVSDGNALVNHHTGHINLWVYENIDLYLKFKVI